MKSCEQKINKGYTLLEVVISMSLFVMIIVPLISMLGSEAGFERERQRIVALSLLEKECALILLSPHQALPEKRIDAAGRSWIVKTTRRGSPLTFFTVSIVLDKNIIAEAGFYVNMR